MAAKVYGDIEWGMTAEDGMYAQSFDFTYSAQELYIADEDGDDVSGAIFNPSASFALNGFKKTSGTQMEPKLGAALTMANDEESESFVDGTLTGAKALVTSVKRGLKTRDAATLDISGSWKPFMGGLA